MNIEKPYYQRRRQPQESLIYPETGSNAYNQGQRTSQNQWQSSKMNTQSQPRERSRDRSANNIAPRLNQRNAYVNQHREDQMVETVSKKPFSVKQEGRNHAFPHQNKPNYGEGPQQNYQRQPQKYASKLLNNQKQFQEKDQDPPLNTYSKQMQQNHGENKNHYNKFQNDTKIINKMCKNILQDGICQRGDLCIFAHKKSQDPCPFYQQNNCKYQESECRFTHSKGQQRPANLNEFQEATATIQWGNHQKPSSQIVNKILQPLAGNKYKQKPDEKIVNQSARKTSINQENAIVKQIPAYLQADAELWKEITGEDFKPWINLSQDEIKKILNK